MGDILSLSKKLERAMRNGTGFQITQDEVAAMIEGDVVDAVMTAKLRKLKALCPGTANTLSANTGSMSDGMENPPASSRFVATPKQLAPSFIKALGVGF